MGRPSSARMGGVILIALFAMTSACSSKNDVVATQSSDTVQRPDAALSSRAVTLPCEAGTYSGTLFTIPRADGGPAAQYSGRIDFVITRSMSGEFLVIDDTAQLSGMGDDGSSFQAEIMNGSCNDGVVEATLQMGTYTTFTNAEKTATIAIPFDGTIEGRFVAEFAGFIGGWTTALHLPGGDLVVAGTWSASRTH